MTSLERLQAASRGESVDRKPVICEWIPEAGLVDALIDVDHVTRADIDSYLQDHPDLVLLKAIRRQLTFDSNVCPTLIQLLADDPEQGHKIMLRHQDEMLQEVQSARDSGAHGICYCLGGAAPSYATPMQYGGYFLELDRALLELAASVCEFSLIFVETGPETYFDCLSDLPANAFGWDIRYSGIGVEEMRTIRPGALACNDPSGDILLQVFRD